MPTHKQATYRAHSDRFRQVSNRYSRLVAEAYDDDLDRAARDTDEQVAATVAAWEREHGIDPVDWYAVGTSEGRDPDRRRRGRRTAISERDGRAGQARGASPNLARERR